MATSRRDFLGITAGAAIGGGLLLRFGLAAGAEIRDTPTIGAA